MNFSSRRIGLMFTKTVSILLITLTTISFGGDFVFLVDTGCDFGPLVLQKKSDTSVKVTPKTCDTLFKKEDWQAVPQVQAPNVIAKKAYLLMMLDPDGPNLEPGVFYMHWVVANIPGKCLLNGTGDLNKGHTLAEYKGPNPPKGSGQHRYVFLLYEQDNQTSRIRGKIEKRAQFDLGCWLNPLAKRYPLTGPVAGSQFRIMPDL